MRKKLLSFAGGISFFSSLAILILVKSVQFHVLSGGRGGGHWAPHYDPYYGGGPYYYAGSPYAYGGYGGYGGGYGGGGGGKCLSVTSFVYIYHISAWLGLLDSTKLLFFDSVHVCLCMCPLMTWISFLPLNPHKALRHVYTIQA